MAGEGQTIMERKILGAYWQQWGQSVVSDWTKGFSEAAGDPLGEEEMIQGK